MSLEPEEKERELEKEPYKLVLKFQFAKDYWAEYARQAINADPEPRPSVIKRCMSAHPDGTLQVEFISKDLKLIRTASSAMMEYMELVFDTFKNFDAQLNPHLY
jgi:hypothetical protein